MFVIRLNSLELLETGNKLVGGCDNSFKVHIFSIKVSIIILHFILILAF
jgi:hypothetical protein